MNKILMVSPNKCTDCRTCESVCYNDAVNVISIEDEDKTLSVSVMCMQCDDAACLEICPTGALSRDCSDTVIVDAEKCIGCRMCVAACPFGNIQYSARKKKIIKCDLCEGSPDCVKYCPTQAIEFVSATESNLKKKRILASKFKGLFE
jgi:Fe-S-cluster-containing hydrogenase component 2